MTAPVILAEHLTKRFAGCRGINDVNLQVEPGQVFGFLGPNGAAKTTTIRRLLGLYRPTSGRALVLSRELLDAMIAAGLASPGEDLGVRAALFLVDDLAFVLLGNQVAAAIKSDPFWSEGIAPWGREVTHAYSRGTFARAPKESA